MQYHSLKPIVVSAAKDKDNSADIRHNLELALDSRALCHLEFLREGSLQFQTRGSIQELSLNQVIMNILDEPSKLLEAGTKVWAYFFLTIAQKKMPFHFSSTLAYSMRRWEDKAITVDFPTQMGHMQRRHSYRLPLSNHSLKDFNVWCCQLQSAPNQPPHPTWIPVEKECVEIQDISVGGAQINISRKSTVSPLLKKKSTLLMSATFPSKTRAPMKLLMAANVVRLETHERIPATKLGVRFNRWTNMDPQGLHWVTVNQEDGITPLASWIVQADIERSKAV